MPRFRRVVLPAALPAGVVERAVRLAHPLPEDRVRPMSVREVAREVGLPPADVAQLLREVNRELAAQAKRRREVRRLAERVAASLTPRPLYVRDGQDNPVPNERLRRERNPGTRGEAAHTGPDNRVDPDYLESRRAGL